MTLIERLEKAQEQTWWLPDSAAVYQGADHCFYLNGGRFSIVRFTPSSGELKSRVRQCLAMDAQTEAPLSQAGISLYPELKVAFMFAGGTLESARGRGAYPAFVAAWVAHARSIGIDHIGLLAREDSSSPIVDRQGFEYCGEIQEWSLNGV